VQGLVELTVPRGVQPHAHRLATGGRDGGGPTKHGEGGIAAAAAGMGPGTQDNGGHDRAHAGPAEEVGSPGPDQGGAGLGVLGDLGVQEKEPGQAGAVAAGAPDRPHPAAGLVSASASSCR
jgi:hypothetical protein